MKLHQKIDLLAAIAFFICYKNFGLLAATKILIIISIISLLLSLLINKKVEKTQLISTLLIIVLGSFGIIFNNSKFIKMKPTLLYLTFSLSLWISLLLKKPIIKSLFTKLLDLNQKSWNLLTGAWAIFFIFLAILNELIWRNFSEQTWVYFKVFGITPIIATAIFIQIFALKKSLKTDR